MYITYCSVTLALTDVHVLDIQYYMYVNKYDISTFCIVLIEVQRSTHCYMLHNNTHTCISRDLLVRCNCVTPLLILTSDIVHSY